MDETQKLMIQHLVDDFGAHPDAFAGESWMILPPEKLTPAVAWLHSQGFAYLAMVTAVDYWPQEHPRFHLVYRLVAFATQTTINLRVPVPGISPSVPTLEKFYRNANWQEREVYDMFGIQFEGHSDLRRILMPADWQGHPQRKDYPLGYEEPQYSFNFDEIAGRKPHAREVE